MVALPSGLVKTSRELSAAHLASPFVRILLNERSSRPFAPNWQRRIRCIRSRVPKAQSRTLFDATPLLWGRDCLQIPRLSALRTRIMHHNTTQHSVHSHAFLDHITVDSVFINVVTHNLYDIEVLVALVRDNVVL